MEKSVADLELGKQLLYILFYDSIVHYLHSTDFTCLYIKFTVYIKFNVFLGVCTVFYCFTIRNYHFIIAFPPYF